MLGALIQTPRHREPADATAQGSDFAGPVAIFGTIVAPVCEELAFRGFLQPLLVRSLGASPVFSPQRCRSACSIFRSTENRGGTSC